MERLTVLFAATTLALGATSAWLSQQLSSERRQAASLAERAASLESAGVRGGDQPVPGANPTHADGAAASGLPAGPDASRAHPAGSDALQRLAQLRINESRLLRDPRYRERWLAWMSLRLRASYADLQRSLGLSDTEYESFLATLAHFELEQTLRSYDVPLDKHLDPAERLAAARQAIADKQTARRQVLRDSLGEARFRQWVDHERTAEGRQDLERWRIELAVAGQPLTPDQAQDLLPVLVEYQRRVNALPNDAALAARALANSVDASSAIVDSERHISSRAEINAWLGDALSGVLTMEQRDLITSAGQREIELSRAQLELNRLRLEESHP